MGELLEMTLFDPSLSEKAIAKRMEHLELKSVCELEEQIFRIFSDFMAGYAKLEELGTLGSRLLADFQQGLEFLRRPPINKTSKLVENILIANDNKRVKSYVQAGCKNTHDSVQNISKLHACTRGLHDHLFQAKCILDELNSLIEDATYVLQTANEGSSFFQNKEIDNELDELAASHENMEAILSSRNEKPQITDYAVMIGSIYCTLKQDCLMQEKIVTSLNLTTSSGKLESYCLMWSLRPYINDEIIHQAWKLIPQ